MNKNELIPDPILGIRWKNGAFDRKMRGDGNKKRDKVKLLKTSGLNTFLVDFFGKFDSVAELAIGNSLLFEGMDDPDQLLTTRNRTFSQIFDVDASEVDEVNFNFMTYRLRLSFLRYYSVLLNGLSSAVMYAEFSGMKETTVRSQMERGKFDIVSICGTRFILVPEEQMMWYNEFLMRRWLSVAKYDPKQAAKDNRMLAIYEKLYPGRKIEVIDTIEKWIESEGMVISQEDGATHGKMYAEGAWQMYCFWCKEEGLPAESLKTFSMKIYEMGFRRFNSKKRGFYFWRKGIIL